MMQLIGQVDHWIKTSRVAPEKIISLFQIDLRSIPRGRIGKEIEFGLKWGIYQIRGGYIHLFMMKEMRLADCNYAVEAIREHIRLFGVAPKGRAAWKVSSACEERIKSERAQGEGKIGTIKHYGFNKPEERSTPGMMRAARRAELRFNLGKYLRDLTTQATGQRFITT